MIVSKTPLRASFFGGGSDFAEYFRNNKYGYGTVLSTTVNMYVYITVLKKFDNKIRVCYSENELVDRVEDIKHNLIREALKTTGVDHGVEILYTADLPLGSAGVGLASSSAIAVGTLNALYAYQGIYASPEMLARKACEIEIGRLKHPIGIQDQYAVAYGGFRQYKFYRDGSVSAAPLICPPEILGELHSHLMLFYSGITRDSSKIMKEQNDTIHSKMPLFDSMVEEAEQAYKNLTYGKLDEWGYALDRVWEKKKKFASGVSKPLIEDMYCKAKNAGALGGKILGAGGGGFMMLYVPLEKQLAVKEALKDFRQIDFSFEAAGSQIVFAE